MTRSPDRIFDGYVFDLDGTVYLGDELLPGAKETLGELKRLSGVVYLTNKPLQMPADYAAKLTGLGIETSPEEVVSSTDALLLYLRGQAPGARLFVIGEKPLVDLLRAGGYEVLDHDGVNVVVVSFDRTFDYRKLKVSFDAVRGAEAVVGKPSRHMARTVLERLGLPARNTLLVGDRLATDVRLAKRAGMAGALILTGATTLDEALGSGDRPDYIIEDLRELLPSGDEPGAATQAAGE